MSAPHEGVDLRSLVHRYLLTKTDFIKVKDTMNEDQLRMFVNKAITDMCEQMEVVIALDQRNVLINSLVSAVMSLGPLRPLMEDKSISEIMVNGASKIYVQSKGRIHLTDIKFEDNKHLMHTVQKIIAASGSNKRVDESSPYVDFSLPDGSRVNVILPPCSLVGPVMTIRRFNEDIGTVDDLINLQMIDKRIAALLIAAMKAKLNVVFCGSTGAGKTTMLNVFSRHIPEHERIITIEDTPELRLLQQHVVPLISKVANIEGKGEISIRDLFINSLRMRPDRLIVGEVRGPEILDLIQSISSGHSGSLAIVHAETPEDCFNRMVTMMLMTGIQLGTSEIQKQVARAVDIIVHISLFLDGKRRVTAVTDLYFDEKQGKTILNNIFEYKQTDVGPNGEVIGDWQHNKNKPTFYEKFRNRMVTLPDGFFDEQSKPLKDAY
jgi:pilus assembly protein CpaF